MKGSIHHLKGVVQEKIEIIKHSNALKGYIHQLKGVKGVKALVHHLKGEGRVAGKI